MRTPDEIEARLKDYIVQYKELRLQLDDTKDENKKWQIQLDLAVIGFRCVELHWALGIELDADSFHFPDMLDY